MGEFAQVCAKLFWHEKFIAPSPIPNPTPSLAPGSVRDLKPELRGASRSVGTTSLLQLHSAVRPTFNVKNWFFRFLGHESTQSSKYNLGILTQNPINWEDERRKCFHCSWQIRSWLYCVSIPSLT